MSSIETSILKTKLDSILEDLLAAADASRCTLRFDDANRGWHVDFAIAEALAPGVKSLRGVGGINQRAAATVHWLSKHRRNLVQPDLLNSPDPAPPAALMTAYAATAQMLAPLFNRNDELQGWISVHYVGGPRKLSARDQAALNVARLKVASLLDMSE